MNKLLVSILVFGTLAPVSVFALEGIGPRVTVTGTVQSMVVSKDQEWQEYGGEMTLAASNGQTVTIVFTKDTQIISEGRMSRKEILPINLTKGMEVRVRGWRLGTDSLTASLVILQNIELNPVLSTSGILQNIDSTGIIVTEQNGIVKHYTVTAETEVNVNYALRGLEGLSLIGKEVLLTLNPRDNTMVRVIRITGNKEEALLKPTTVQLGRRR